MLTTSHEINAGRTVGGGAGKAPRWVRKLEDDYFENWEAGTELNRDEFKQTMRIELRRQK